MSNPSNDLKIRDILFLAYRQEHHLMFLFCRSTNFKIRISIQTNFANPRHINSSFILNKRKANENWTAIHIFYKGKHWVDMRNYMSLKNDYFQAYNNYEIFS